MARVKCPMLNRFTLLVFKVYSLRNEFNFEICNETLIKNNVFYFKESKEGLGGYYK
jgi:hypothetical protein